MPARYHILLPAAPGETGAKTVFDRSSARVEISVLHFIFEGWQGDHLLAASPSYLVSEDLGAALLAAHLTGFVLANCLLERSPQFQGDFNSLPKFKWLQIDGRAQIDDFGISGGRDLVVSDRALRAIQQFPLKHCYIDDADKPLTFEERKRRIYLDTFKKLGLPPPPKLKK